MVHMKKAFRAFLFQWFTPPFFPSCFSVFCLPSCVDFVVHTDMVSQQVALAKRPHVIVATPGRIVDHLKTTKGFNLRELQYLVCCN